MFSEETTIHCVFTSGTEQQENMVELTFNLLKNVILNLYGLFSKSKAMAPYRTWKVLLIAR